MKKKPMSAISLKSRGKNIQAARELASLCCFETKHQPKPVVVGDLKDKKLKKKGSPPM